LTSIAGGASDRSREQSRPSKEKKGEREGLEGKKSLVGVHKTIENYNRRLPHKRDGPREKVWGKIEREGKPRFGKGPGMK